MDINKKNKYSFVKVLLITFFISIGLILSYFNSNLIELFLGSFFLILGVLLFLYYIKFRNSATNLTNFDERSEINRLKAADFSFKFLFLTINGLLLFYFLNPVNIEIFLALLSPLIAFSIIIYFSYFYWNERRIE